MKVEVTTSVKPQEHIDLSPSLRSEDFERILEVSLFTASRLSARKKHLTQRVISRCIAIADVLNLNNAVRLQLELAARVHRIGELYLNQALQDKCFIDMNHAELRAYRHYPIFSALRVGEGEDCPLHNTLLLHREYFEGAGFLGQASGTAIPLTARILCAASEFEELVLYKATDVSSELRLQNRFLANNAGRYDPDILDALVLTLEEELITH
ncbi:MAG: hypothetical protein KDI36_10405 [Pseudomonadales bacterium]|nr:hypothetical protein [Pseudomonadales bacterium]